MSTISIITTAGCIDLEAERWRRDEANDVYVYNDDNGDDPVATIDSDRFVAAYRSAAGEQRTETDPQPRT